MMNKPKLIFTRYARGTYLAVFPGAAARATSTAGESAAARSLISKSHGEASVETLRKATKNEVASHKPKTAKQGQYTAWLFDAAAKKGAIAQTETAPESGELVVRSEDIDGCNRMYSEIQNLAETARETAEKACRFAVVLGVILLEIKARTPHGGWQELFAKKGKTDTVSVFGFTSKTAVRYMKLAEGALARPGLPATSKKNILALGSAPPSELSDDLHGDLKKATRGETLRQAYLDLGIIRASAAEKRTEKNDDEEEEEGDDTPPLTESAIVWGALKGPVSDFSRMVEAGELALLEDAQVRELKGKVQRWLDALNAIGKAAK